MRRRRPVATAEETPLTRLILIASAIPPGGSAQNPKEGTQQAMLTRKQLALPLHVPGSARVGAGILSGLTRSA